MRILNKYDFYFSSLDIDECRDKPDICQNGACRNLAGTYICDCDSGYQRSTDGKECEGKMTHSNKKKNKQTNKTKLGFTCDVLAFHPGDRFVCLFLCFFDLVLFVCFVFLYLLFEITWH